MIKGVRIHTASWLAVNEAEQLQTTQSAHADRCLMSKVPTLKHVCINHGSMEEGSFVWLITNSFTPGEETAPG